MPADPYAEELAYQSLRFLERAHLGGGRFRLRLSASGRWRPEPPSDDAAGRALLGLGVATVAAPWEVVRERAGRLFVEAAGFRSSWPRAAAYAALGAAEVALSAHADGRYREAARLLLAGAAEVLPLPVGSPSEEQWGQLGDGQLGDGQLGDGQLGDGQLGDGQTPGKRSWRWPEARLTYANALLPAGLLAAGEALGRDDLVLGGLDLLDWLVDEEALEGRFSFAPVGGRGPRGPKPAWDQQPIEAAAMANACAWALRLSGEKRWHGPLKAALWWWLGRNDGAALVWDPATGGGHDGLHRDGVNANQGAESTIALVGSMVLAQAQALSASSRLETEALAAPT